MSSCQLGQYKGNFYIIDEVLIANLSPAKAPVTRMRFQIVPFQERIKNASFSPVRFHIRPCVFK